MNIRQCVIILRGGPAVGKTRIAKELRACLPRAIAIDVDQVIKMIGNFDLFSKKWGHVGSRHLADLFASQGWHIILEELFINPSSLQNVRDWAGSRNLPYFIFHLTATIEDIYARNKDINRDILDNERLFELYTRAESSRPFDAIVIDTSKNSVSVCVDLILNRIRG